MSKRTYLRLTSILRFDNVFSRRQSRSMDKFAPIRGLFNEWSDLLPLYCNPGECVTIDEQLLGFHGRCPFRQYMPNKPEKYGIKFWLCVCATSLYVWKIQPYLGKNSADAAPEKNQGERVVLDLIDGLKGHNVTMDNFFSSYRLGQLLLQKNITMVGTMRKNKRSIPPKLLLCKKKPLYQSTYAFTMDTTLVSYISKKNKCTVLQSTMHDSAEIGTDPKKKPNIVAYYNKTKGGVDTVDKMLSCYSVKRKTNRWPMAVFSNMVDISALNAYIIYSTVNPQWHPKQKRTRRADFLRELALQLAENYKSKRERRSRSRSCSLSSSCHYLESSSSNFVDDLDDVSVEGPSAKRRREVPPMPPKKRGRCDMCCKEQNPKKDFKYEAVCCKCLKNVCKQDHSRIMCLNCISEQ